MGLIDVHIHGFKGFDTKDALAQDILKIAGFLGENNITGFLPTVYPRGIDKMRRDMENIVKAMQIQRSMGKEGAAEILGIHLEGPFLNPKKAGALDKKSFLDPKEYHLEMLIDGFEDFIRVITIAPELDSSIGLIKKMVHMGITVSMGHSEAKYHEAEEGFLAGAKGITHIFNATRPMHHREPGIAGFGLINQDVFIEVIADPYHLHIKTLEMIFRIKNPDRIIVVSDGVKYTGSVAPVVDKNNKLLGGSMLIDESAKILIEAGLERDLVLRCMSINPSIYIERI